MTEEKGGDIVSSTQCRFKWRHIFIIFICVALGVCLLGGNTQILRDERAPEEIKNMMWVIDAVKHVPDIVGVFIILLIPSYLLWAFWPPLTAWFKSLNRKAQTNKAETTPQPFDIAQLSDAALELIAGALLRERPVIVKPNGLFFEHERNQPRFIFDEPLKDRTFDDVLKELVEFKLFKKAGSFYEVAPLAQKNRKSIVELDSKRVLGALLQTSLGETLLKFANGEGARLSVDVAEIVPPDSHRTAMRRHDDFERDVPSNFSFGCFPIAETDRIFHLLLKNLLVDKWDMSKDELSPPFSQAKIPWNNGNPINARFNLPEGGSLRGLAGMKREGAFAYGCITARLTERGCEISRLYLASNQGDN